MSEVPDIVMHNVLTKKAGEIVMLFKGQSYMMDNSFEKYFLKNKESLLAAIVYYHMNA